MALTKIPSSLIEQANQSITSSMIEDTLDLTSKTVSVATATAGDNDTTVASTAFVASALAALVDSSPTTLDTLNELAAALGDDPNFATTVTNSIATKLPLSGGTLTGNLNFGDNDKAVFGAGSDLQIYHDGNNSYINDAGTGALLIRGSNVALAKYTGETMVNAFADGRVDLYYDNDIKLTTTTTGIDVTGTATMDGLTVVASNALGTIQASSATDATLNITSAGITAYSLVTSGTDSSFAIKKDGAERMRISSAGFVGIGTTNPARKLAVEGTGVIFNNTGGAHEVLFGDAAYRYFSLYTPASPDYMSIRTGTTDLLTVKADGNVGIGTSAPSRKVSVWDTVNGYNLELQQRSAYNSGNQSGVVFSAKYHSDGSVTDLASIRGGKENTTDNNYAGKLSFFTRPHGGSDTERMRIDSSGRVGIGTSSFVNINAKFVVSNGTVDIEHYTDTGFSVGYVGTRTNHDFGLLANGTPKLYITTAGNVGIGTISPSDKLTIKAASAHLRLQGTSNTNKNVSIFYNESGDYGQINCDEAGVNQKDLWMTGLNLKFGRNTGSESMRIDASGNVLVGTTSTAVAALTSGGGSVISSAGATAIAYQSVNATDPVLLLNNTGVDGSMVEFRKDGTTVGSIGTIAGYMTVGTSDAGVLFHSGEDNIQPWNVSTNTGRDNAISLGAHNARFKDLYLSGLAYVGGVYNTGIYNQQSGDIQFWVTNVGEAVRIQQNTGNVGIGTSAPQSKLELNLTSAVVSSAMNTNTVNDVQLIRAPFNASPHNTSGYGAKWGLRFVGRNDGTYDNGKSAAIYAVSEDTLGYNRSVGLAFHTSPNDEVNTERMRITSNGRVGIGTTSPAYPLHVNGTLHVGISGATANDVTGTLNIGNTGTYYMTQIKAINVTANPSILNTRMGFFTLSGTGETVSDSTEKMSILAGSGNVGIGTTTPGAPLHVNSDTEHQIKIQSTASAGASMQLYSGGSYSYTVYQHPNANFRIGAYGGTSFIIRDQGNAADRLTIINNGNVGIGTSSPTGSLHTTAKDSNGSDVFVVAQNTTSNRIAGFKVLDESGTASLLMQYDNGSNVASISNPNNGSLGIYLGGTGAANLLDDYEEGTWTASGPPIYNTVCRYVKIGSLVTLHGTLSYGPSTTGSFTLAGVPFACGSYASGGSGLSTTDDQIQVLSIAAGGFVVKFNLATAATNFESFTFSLTYSVT